jgi:serine protease Do
VPPGTSVVKFGDSDQAEVGDQVFVIGAPLGMAHTLTVGHVSARRSGGSEGLGFVVTSNLARRLLFEEPTVWSGLEGFLMTPEIAAAFNVPGNGAALLVQTVAEGSPAARLGLRGGTLPATLGQEPVLLGGDIVVSVEGISVGAPEAYEQIRRRMIAAQEKGSAVSVTVLREGKTEVLTGIAVRPR